MKARPATVQFIRLFSRYLREQGLPVTHQREAVAEVVFGADDHLSVDDIEQSLTEQSQIRDGINDIDKFRGQINTIKDRLRKLF